MTHGGLDLETRRTGTPPSGDVAELSVFGWDAAANVHRQDGHNNRGRVTPSDEARACYVLSLVLARGFWHKEGCPSLRRVPEPGIRAM
jgi:hypothetical protein